MRLGIKIGPLIIMSGTLGRRAKSAYARHRDRQALLIFAAIAVVALAASFIH